MMKSLLISAAALVLVGCAGVTPVGQRVNEVKDVAKQAAGAQVDASLDSCRQLTCMDISYRAERDARTRFGVTGEVWSAWCKALRNPAAAR